MKLVWTDFNMKERSEEAKEKIEEFRDLEGGEGSPVRSFESKGQNSKLKIF